MKSCLTATLSILALMIVTPSVRADVQDKVKEMQSPADSKQFAMKAAEGGMLEVKLAQLAQQKSQSQEVKQLAQQLEQDHAQANQQLMKVAKQKNIELPTELKGECQETYQAFQQLQGNDFDNAFLLHNVKDHLKDIMMFQKEAQKGTDQEIRQWAAQCLPKLQQHAQHIRTVAQSAGLPIDVLAGGNMARDAARTAGSRIQGAGSSDRSSDTGTGTSGSTGSRGNSSGSGASGTSGGTNRDK
jgi:putative membrane protein